MRLFLAFVASILTCKTAWAQLNSIATSGAWSTVEDIGTEVKVCGVRATVNDGQFMLFGATNRQTVLQIKLEKAIWKIPGIAVPIEISFDGGQVFKIAGSGKDSTISAEIPALSAKSFIHFFTASDNATITLPEGHETPWQLNLHGTTPTILAMTPCIDASGVLLPPPFRLPEQSPVSDVTTVHIPDTVGNQASPDLATTNIPAAESQTQSLIAAPNLLPPQPLAPTSDTQPNPQRADDTSSLGEFLLVAVAIVIGVGCLVLYFRERERREEADRRASALTTVVTEIAEHRRNLGIRMSQTINRDHYGTPNRDMWIKEREYFYSTRVRPKLTSTGQGHYADILHDESILLIEAAATEGASSFDSIPSFRSSPDLYDPRMSPIDYEKFCAKQLIQNGWDARTTISTGDQGADVIATMSGVVLVVQCKLYSSPVGNDAVQQAFAAMRFQNAHKAAVVSNQPYTRSARQLAETNGVMLLHHDHLSSLNP